MKEYEKIKQLVAIIEEDVLKFSEKGNAAAGTRVRKGLQDIKRACRKCVMLFRQPRKQSNLFHKFIKD